MNYAIGANLSQGPLPPLRRAFTPCQAACRCQERVSSGRGLCGGMGGGGLGRDGGTASWRAFGVTLCAAAAAPPLEELVSNKSVAM